MIELFSTTGLAQGALLWLALITILTAPLWARHETTGKSARPTRVTAMPEQGPQSPGSGSRPR